MVKKSFTKFPKFHQLTVYDKSTYLTYYSQLKEPPSDFSFDNVLIWLNYYNDLEVSDLNGNLVMRFTNILDADSLSYSLIGSKRIKTTIVTLLEFLNHHTEILKLSYIPEQVVDKIKLLEHPHLRIEEDVDNKDYVYNTESLASMHGKSYRNLRERVIKFESGKNIQTRLFDCSKTEERTLVESTVVVWSKHEKSQRNDPEKIELNAIKKHLDLAAHLSLRVYGIYIDNELACIIITHIPPQKGWLIGNHLKYSHDSPGAFGYAIHTLAVLAQKEGIQWLNCEQDLGKDGLRFIKTILRPAKFVRRYTVWLEPGNKNQ